MSFDLDCEGQNNNCSVRSLELDGYCFNDFHHQPPNHRLITDIPSAVNVWRNLAAGDLKVTLKDVYLTDNLVVFTISLGTSKSASNHVSSGAVFINGEQRFGGGSAGEAEGEPY